VFEYWVKQTDASRFFVLILEELGIKVIVDAQMRSFLLMLAMVWYEQLFK
jgi:hypothetical protein